MLGILVAGAVCIGLGALLLHQQIKWKAGCKAGAAKIYREVSEMYRGEHAYRVAAEAEFPRLDLSGYRQVREALTARGFRYLGAFENLTVSGVHPDHRCFIDSYAAADGLSGVATYRVLDRQTVDVASVLEDGRFLVTTNAELDSLTPPPTVMKCTLPFDTPLAELLEGHLKRLANLRTAEPSASFVAPTTVEEVIAVSRRHSLLVSEYRRRVGLITEEEMLAFASRRDQEATARQIWKEFVTLRLEDRGVAQQGVEADEA